MYENKQTLNDSDKSEDFFLFLDDKNNQKIIKNFNLFNDKFNEKDNSNNAPNTIGKFRNDVIELKKMRIEFKNKNLSKINETSKENYFILEPKLQDIEIKSIEMPKETEPIEKWMWLKPTVLKLNYKFPPTLKASPSNPLIDQTVRVIKPTKWIDCISRESKRIFVKDNWIIARIQIPTFSKDDLGLKNI